MDDPNKDAYGEHEKDTPQGRVLHYAHWHAEAYGCPAPLEEVVAQVMVRHGMSGRDATALVMEMDAKCLIELREHELGTEVVPNTQIAGQRGPAHR